MEDRDCNGDVIRYCDACDWCKSLEDSEGRTIYFCMDANSGAYLEETGLCGNCTVSAEDEDAPGGWQKEKALTMWANIVKASP